MEEQQDSLRTVKGEGTCWSYTCVLRPRYERGTTNGLFPSPARNTRGSLERFSIQGTHSCGSLEEDETSVSSFETSKPSLLLGVTGLGLLLLLLEEFRGWRAGVGAIGRKPSWCVFIFLLLQKSRSRKIRSDMGLFALHTWKSNSLSLSLDSARTRGGAFGR